VPDPERLDLLKRCFGLQDHPFTPAVDPIANFDFVTTNASLMAELDVFAHRALLPYFADIGGFAGAIGQARAFLDRTGFPGGGPVVFLIAGPSGAGRSTTANYIARLMSDRPSSRPLALRRATLSTDNYEKVLLNLLTPLRAYAKTAATTQPAYAAASDEAIETIDQGRAAIDKVNPDPGAVRQLFLDLRPPMSQLPGVVMVAEGVTYSRMKWPHELHADLGPLNVNLIALTEGSDVLRWFRNQTQQTGIRGLALSIEELTAADGIEFLKRRLAIFRAAASQPADDLFPFERGVLEQAFANNRMRVRLFLNLLMGALEGKLTDLAAAAPGAADCGRVSLNYFKSGYKDLIRANAPADPTR
jgi:energy-coupling factor transporter ATP-binding protein EcfA2